MNECEVIAKALNGVEYCKELDYFDEARLKDRGIVVAFTASDDLLEFRGAIDEELGCWEGGKFGFFLGRLASDEEVNEVVEFLKDVNFECPKFNPSINVKWCPKKDEKAYASFEITTSFGSYPFNVLKDEDVYCIGRVFYIKDLIEACK